MSATETKTFSPEDLLAMPDGIDYELVDGQLVARNVGSISSWVGGRLYGLLFAYCQARALGWVWPADKGFQCFPDAPDKVRKPDVSFIKSDRLHNDQLPEGFVKIAPDLAVEVVSPNDRVYEVDAKVLEYLGAGVPLVWVINPKVRIACVHRADGSTQLLRETDELSGEQVVPGFRCSVRELFPPDPQPTTTNVPQSP